MITTIDVDQVRFETDPEYRKRITEVVELRELLTAERARTDINIFIPFVFEFEQTPYHRYVQDFFDYNTRASADLPPESGKTFQVSIARKLYQIGQDNTHTMGLVSNTADVPEACLQVLKTRIEESRRLKMVFPNLRISDFKRTKVGNLTLTVERPRDANIKDATITAMGVAGSIVGRRWTLLDTDDMQDLDNTWTHNEREKLSQRFEMQMRPRLLEGAPHEDIGTPFHIEDTRHRIRQKPGYAYIRGDHWTGCIYDINGKTLAHFGDTLWPASWIDPITKRQYGMPRGRLEELAKNTPEMEFNRLWRCISVSDTMATFKQEDIEYCKTLGMRMGLLECPTQPRVDEAVVTGVDLAVSKSDAADRCAMHTLAIREGPHGTTKCTLDIRAGRWELRRILREFLLVLRLYPNHMGFRVETNAGQDYIRQALQDREISHAVGFTDTDLARLRIIPHTTTSQNKSHALFGIKGMSVDFEQRRWAVPCGREMELNPEVRDFLYGLMTFSPLSHTNDNVIAAWLASEQARLFGISGGDWSRYGVA